MMIKQLTKQLLLTLLLSSLVLPAWSQDDELLEPEKAFALQEPEISADSVTLNWKIAPGYYLYQNKFAFELVDGGSQLGEPSMSESLLKHDEFFGEVQVYKKSARVSLPVNRSGTDAEDVTLKVVVQGCNEPVGVCYPPLSKDLKISLPAVNDAAASTAPETGPVSTDSTPKTRAGLASLIGGAQTEDEFLPPDEAFKLVVEPVPGGKVDVSLVIADGYYVYRDKVSFASATPGVKVEPYQLPEGKIKEDEFLGRTAVYYHNLNTVLDISGSSENSQFELVAKYQGCAEKGICYPPITKTVSLALDAASQPALAEGAQTNGDIGTNASEQVSVPADGTVSEEQSIVNMLTGGSYGTTILAFFLIGLGLALTPCVFPMIPILSGIIVGQGEDITRGKSFMLSVAYVLGMSIMYTIAGVLAGLTGELLSSAFQSPWVLSIAALVFVLLSLSMFGFYDLQLPASLQSKLTEKSNRIRGGAYSGVFVMGALSALIVGPCVAAPLSGALIYIGQTGDVILGGLSLFVMSLGMGVPLLLIGASAGSLLPRAGGWMNAVKAVFGVLMLGVAIWLLERILPISVIMAMWAALLIVSAIYMRALDSLPDDASGWRRLWKGVGLIGFIYGIALLFGSMTGATDVFKPLEKVSAPQQYMSQPGQPAKGLEFQKIKGMEKLQAALDQAADQGKPAFIDFYADWCVECVRMENTTFKSPLVAQAMEGYKLIKLDVTANDDADKKVLKQFNLFGPPAMLFFGPDGKEIKSMRVIGYQDEVEFKNTVDQVSELSGLK
jgi:thiol:disulfide interchange protein DsbD